MRSLNPIIFLVVAQTIALTGQERRKFHEEEVHMGTLFQITVFHHDDKEARLAISNAFQRINYLDSLLSNFRLDSEVAALSSFSKNDEVTISEELFFLLSEGQKLARASQGAFCVSCGQLTRVWRRAIRQKELPDSDQIAWLTAKSDTTNFSLSEDRVAVRINDDKLLIDLGAIAKGYAVDEAFKILQSHQIEMAIIDGGGDIFAGQSPDEEGWRIAVLDSIIHLKDYSGIATSGALFKRVEIEGQSYSHIVDPRTGIGIRRIDPVSVIAERCYLADALATVFSIDATIDLHPVFNFQIISP